jgi:hypothetical protein
MGHSESADSFVGYCVSIADLLKNIHDEESLTYAYDTLTDSDVFLADDNDEDNNTFLDLVENLEMDEDDSWELNKKMLLKKMATLVHHQLLVPVIELASNTRWGYNREGVNGSYECVSDDFNERLNELYAKCPPDHTVVWILRQSGG